MKRAWMKKVNAVPTNADKDEMEEQLKPVQPKVRRRLRTSVAMFGLAISIGGPTLLLTRQSDRTPAAEKPPSNEPITNTVTVATTTVKSFSEAPPSSVVIEAVSTPIASPVAPPLVPVTVAEVQPAPVVTIQPQPQSIAQTKLKVAATKTTTVQISRQQPIATIRSVERDTNSQATPALSVAQRQKRLVQKLKAATPVVVVNNEQLHKVVEQVPVANVDGSSINPKQKLLVNRLKQQSNHPQNSSAELRFEESQASRASEAIAPAPPSITSQAVNSQPSTTNWQRQPAVALTTPRQPQYTAPAQNQQPISASSQTYFNTQSSASPSASRSQTRLSTTADQINLAPSITGIEAQPLGNTSNNSVVVETTPTLPRVAAGLTPQPHNQTSTTPFVRNVPEPLASTTPVFDHAKMPSTVAPSTPMEFGFASHDAVPTVPATPTAATVNVQNPVGQEPQPNSEPKADTEAPVSTPVYVISAESSQSEVRVGIAAPVIDYQVKRGDTLSAIARQHRVSLSELVSANQITNPDQLEVDQTIVIPTEEYNHAVVGQTIAMINRPPQLDTGVAQADGMALSTNAANSIPVVPTISPIANTAPVSTTAEFVSYSATPDVGAAPSGSSAANFTGTGGSFVNEEPLDPPSFYTQGLQADIQRLRQKYNAQQTSRQTNKSVSETSRSTASLLRRQAVRQEPVNPEFRVAQASGNEATTTKAQLATAPTSIDPTEALQSLRGRQVSPELPPLGAVDIYLPKPNAAPFKGYIWPAKGVLTSGYGWRWGRMHRGIDVAAPVGTPIVAAASGVVVRAGWNSGGYGKLVDIRHADGSLTRYAHNNRILVHPGQQIEQGKQIAEMGSTGFSTGPHLHFELHPSGKGAINPMAMLPRR